MAFVSGASSDRGPGRRYFPSHVSEERHWLRLALRGDVEEGRGGGVLRRARKRDGVKVIKVWTAQSMGFGVTELWAQRASQLGSAT